MDESEHHVTVVGFISSPKGVTHRYSLAEHVQRANFQRSELRGTKLRRLGRFMVTLMSDPEGHFRSAQARLYESLLADGYLCSRSMFYRSEDYKPHVSLGPFLAHKQHKKLSSFAVASISVTESRFDLDYTLLGSRVLSTHML